MKNAIQDYIASLNWGYRVSLREKNVKYLNAYGEFVGPHKLKVSLVTIIVLYRSCIVRVVLVLSVEVLVLCVGHSY